MTGRCIQLGVLLAAAGSIVFLWLTDVPLGIPGEWTWARIGVEKDQWFDPALGWIMAGGVGGAYVLLAWAGAKRLRAASGGETALWIGSLVLVGFGWLWVVQESSPDEFRRIKPTWVLYDPGASGYFFEACHRMSDAGSFLAGYENRMAGGDVLHVGTHPPGLFLFHRGLILLCRGSPELSRFLLFTQPNSFQTAFSTVEQNARLTPAPLSEPDRAALWLAALLTQFVGVATVVPLFWLLRFDFSRHTSWLAVVFWPLVPALAVFLPKSDALFPFLGCLFLYLWLEGRRRTSALYCLSAGLVFWFGMFFSLALLPVGLLAGLLTIRDTRTCTGAERPLGKLAASISWAVTGFAAAVALLWLACDVNLLNVWSWNYRNHAAFYDQFPRTYWKWLLVNPLELALFAGLPLIVLAAASAAQTADGWKRKHWAFAIVAGLLWLSGKNMGEAARLWLVLDPWLIWLAGYSLQQATSPKTSNAASPRLTGWLLALTAQAAVCIATVTRVNAFDWLVTAPLSGKG